MPLAGGAAPISIRRNVAANYASQLYVALIGILMLPLYLRYMGPEAYGLVGFFAMLSAWFQLLDMGLTPTFTREVARFRGGATDAATLRGLLHALEAIFFGTALLAGVAAVGLAQPIATDWLKVEQLPLAEVTQAVTLMGLTVPLRWTAGLYRGAVYGFERQVWLGGFNALVATARFVGVIPVLIYLDAKPTTFFAYQLIVAAAELTLLIAVTYRLMPAGSRHAFNWSALRGVLNFALSIAFAGAVWVMLTQSDKLLLSRLLPLADYGYYSLAVLVAGGVNAIGAPISHALLPRLTRLAAEGDKAGLVTLYRRATQAICTIVLPVSLSLALFAERILWVWTGDPTIAAQAGPILALYALGNGLLAVSAFPYYLQYALGDLRLHLVGNALLLLLLIPALLWAATRFGGLGAAMVWAGLNALYFLLWLPLVHRRFLPGLHGSWLRQDIAPIGLATLAAAGLLAAILPWPASRAAQGLVLLLAGMAILAAALPASSLTRALMRQIWHKALGAGSVARS